MRAELDATIIPPSGVFGWRAASASAAEARLELVSGVWQGATWRHELVVVEPGLPGRTCLLYVTGGEPNPADLADAEALARAAGRPAAVLFHVPNQPFEGLSEDELVAESFSRFLETGDPAWPLLAPMAASVLRAMDALQAWSEGRLNDYTLLGASKRAWCAWLAATTGDARASRLVPTVFDNLNMPAQLARQRELWGETSPMLEPYASRGLPERANSPRGARLLDMVDPYRRLGGLRARVLTILGSNDPFWAPDAYSIYAGALARPPAFGELLVLPNEGHVFEDKRLFLREAGRFAAGGGSGALAVRRAGAGLSVAAPAPVAAARLYVAEGTAGRFSESAWVGAELARVSDREARFETVPTRGAAFVEVEMELDGARTTRSTPITLAEDRIPPR